MSILLVEDDPDLGWSLAELLIEEGYQVDLARGGEEALQLLSERADAPPELILLDLVMANMSGIEFRERQLANADWAAIPVIVLSAHPEAPRRAARMQVPDCFVKPMSFDALLQAIHRLVPKRSGLPDARSAPKRKRRATH
jgi:DNA-binding response OmpR family regulator